MKAKKSDKDLIRLEKKLEGISPDKARDFLKEEKILDKDGRLTEYGEHILGSMAARSKKYAS